MESNNAAKGIVYNADQLVALSAIDEFVRGDGQVFILKGFAGTGKTTLMHEVVCRYRDTWHMMAMAPTGRAANVLGARINMAATTIHRGIYSFDGLYIRINKADTADADIKFIYPVRVLELPTLVIVDEASMISNIYAEGELWTFGTNFLLNDLLTFVLSEPHSKILFMGDTAQLPPVGEASSKALDSDFFTKRGLKVHTALLKEVMRQDDGLILRNATATRQAFENKHFSHLVFEEGNDVKSISASSVVQLYTTLHPHPQIGDSAIICYSNAKAADYNEAVRTIMYGTENKPLQSGDLLMIVANHYDRNLQQQRGPKDLMNGEFVKVVGINANPETHTTSVYVKDAGERVKRPISISYQDVTLQLQNGETYECKIITNLLKSKEKALSVPEIKAIYIDFCIRHPELKPQTQEFRLALQTDPYVNALRVKYGYAITCHKAQGGEWDTVIVDFSGVVLCENGLRWIYTAVTRAKKVLYGVNMPDVRPMDKLKVNAITQMNRLPNDWPQLPSCTIDEILENTVYHVVGIKELPYRHRYSISDGTKVHQVDCLYNGQGVITAIQCACTDLKTLLAEPLGEEYRPLQYAPSTTIAQQLFEMMLEACEHAGMSIIAVKENIEHYQIRYLLVGDDKSTMDFFFNSRGFVTHAIPSSMKGLQDNKLNNIVAYITDHTGSTCGQ